MNDDDKPAMVDLAQRLRALGFEARRHRRHAPLPRGKGIQSSWSCKVTEGRPHVVDKIVDGEIDLVINTTFGKKEIADSFSIRRESLMHGIPYYTAVTAPRRGGGDRGAPRRAAHGEELAGVPASLILRGMHLSWFAALALSLAVPAKREPAESISGEGVGASHEACEDRPAHESPYSAFGAPHAKRAPAKKRSGPRLHCNDGSIQTVGQKGDRSAACSDHGGVKEQSAPAQK